MSKPDWEGREEISSLLNLLRMRLSRWVVMQKTNQPDLNLRRSSFLVKQLPLQPRHHFVEQTHKILRNPQAPIRTKVSKKLLWLLQVIRVRVRLNIKILYHPLKDNSLHLQDWGHRVKLFTISNLHRQLVKRNLLEVLLREAKSCHQAKLVNLLPKIHRRKWLRRNQRLLDLNFWQRVIHRLNWN